MLRITTIHQPPDGPILKLEGKLLQPWVAELQRACAAQPAGAPVRLDLAAVTFADAAGMASLRQLVRQGCRIARCSGYVAELLHRETA